MDISRWNAVLPVEVYDLINYFSLEYKFIPGWRYEIGFLVEYLKEPSILGIFIEPNFEPQ